MSAAGELAAEQHVHVGQISWATQMLGLKMGLTMVNPWPILGGT
jgi:hypothetical protein